MCHRLSVERSSESPASRRGSERWPRTRSPVRLIESIGFTDHGFSDFSRFLLGFRPVTSRKALIPSIVNGIARMAVTFVTSAVQDFGYHSHHKAFVKLLQRHFLSILSRRISFDRVIRAVILLRIFAIAAHSKIQSIGRLTQKLLKVAFMPKILISFRYPLIIGDLWTILSGNHATMADNNGC
jgi:hypothetical protein